MSSVKKVWNVITGILVAIVVIIAILLVGVRLTGLKVFTVLSGSMEPTYHTGSIIYVKPVDYHKLKAGDAITFMLNKDTVATHRIVEVVPDESDSDTVRYRTKGDANEVEDGGLVHYKNVIGKPVFTIPYLGYFANYVQHPPGTYTVAAGVAILLLLVFLPEILSAVFSDEGTEKPVKKKEKLTAVNEVAYNTESTDNEEKNRFSRELFGQKNVCLSEEMTACDNTCSSEETAIDNSACSFEETSNEDSAYTIEEPYNDSAYFSEETFLTDDSPLSPEEQDGTEAPVCRRTEQKPVHGKHTGRIKSERSKGRHEL